MWMIACRWCLPDANMRQECKYMASIVTVAHTGSEKLTLTQNRKTDQVKVGAFICPSPDVSASQV